MKDLIFVTWLYLQILLVQCDIFVNNLNRSEATSIKMCIQKTINHLFSENDTLSLLLNGNDLCEDAIFEMSTMRPYIVLNVDVINDVKKLQYDGQFIICSKDVYSLIGTIDNAKNIAKSNNRKLGNSKFLVITKTKDISKIFYIFWWFGINNVIILAYGPGTSKLLTCNRFAPENKCGKAVKLMIHQDCGKQLSLSFTTVIHQMNECPIYFGSTNKNHPSTIALKYIAEVLSDHVNATFQNFMVIQKNVADIIIEVVSGDRLGINDVTEPLLRRDNLWMVPKAAQIYNMNVCLKVFNYDVWIATSIVFICTWLLWFLIISRNGGFTFDKLCISFLNIWSLTIFGNVAQLPRPTSLALRILLLFYLFYAINMQFAFTSDMSTVLTAPQYDFQIRSLEELVDSQLPVYSFNDFKKFYFGMNVTDRKLYTRLQNIIHSVTKAQYIDYLLNLHLHRNYAVITRWEDIRLQEIWFKKKIEAYKITDNSITPAHNTHFGLFRDDFFTPTLNTFVNRMIEGGIHQKITNGVYHAAFGPMNVDDATPEDDLITLKHLAFIFIFFGIGLCTACVVFCFELVLHKYL